MPTIKRRKTDPAPERPRKLRLINLHVDAEYDDVIRRSADNQGVPRAVVYRGIVRAWMTRAGK